MLEAAEVLLTQEVQPQLVALVVEELDSQVVLTEVLVVQTQLTD
jgi:hypothetical protein